MTDIPGAHNRLWHPELAKRDAEAERVKPKCPLFHEDVCGPEPCEPCERLMNALPTLDPCEFCKRSPCACDDIDWEAHYAKEADE